MSEPTRSSSAQESLDSIRSTRKKRPRSSPADSYFPQRSEIVFVGQAPNCSMSRTDPPFKGNVENRLVKLLHLNSTTELWDVADRVNLHRKFAKKKKRASVQTPCYQKHTSIGDVFDVNRPPDVDVLRDIAAKRRKIICLGLSVARLVTSAVFPRECRFRVSP